MAGALHRLNAWARAVRRDVFVLYLAGRDPRVPWPAKAIAVAAVAYALSPIDLIPDFIPVLGYLDELVLVPLAFVLARQLVPREVWDDLSAEAERRITAPLRPSLVAAAVIAGFWIMIALLVAGTIREA
jgi:uncharacterized membrane protein YkvA (DUF1232 family)